MNKKEKETIKEYCIDGLLTDGGHHKQWYLEQILEYLGYNIGIIMDELEEEQEYSFERGIAP